MPSPRTEIDLIQSFADTKVIGMTINHENMNDDEVTEAIRAYQDQLNIPVTDALLRPTELLVQMVLSAHPQLERNASVSVQ
jgi:uncharacterized NAD-dependent epimerase/dehydratase family protein